MPAAPSLAQVSKQGLTILLGRLREGTDTRHLPAMSDWPSRGHSGSWPRTPRPPDASLEEAQPVALVAWGHGLTWERPEAQVRQACHLGAPSAGAQGRSDASGFRRR